MVQKTVLVTGIGGNVGQGIIRNIQATGYRVRVIGCNVVAFSAGNHLCEAVYCVPYAYDGDYLPMIREIVAKENVDLIIPSTDYEVYHLAAARDTVGCAVAASGEETAFQYLDKWETFIFHKKNNIPFADSVLPSGFQPDLYPEWILKPRKGRGSRGLFFNVKDMSRFDDSEYMVQRLVRGKEITTAFYVTRERRLHGHVTLERTLENGATGLCWVNQDYDAQLQPILEAMIAHSDIRGAANLQSIVADDGSIHPFEVNCRISGTNSIRSRFGFEDVRYTLDEYLFGQAPAPVALQPGLAVRLLMDIIYPDATRPDIALNAHSNHFIF